MVESQSLVESKYNSYIVAVACTINNIYIVVGG